MMMMVLVSKQYEVTTKYKMQATPHFSLICQSGEDIIIQKCRSSRFRCRASGCEFLRPDYFRLKATMISHKINKYIR